MTNIFTFAEGVSCCLCANDGRTILVAQDADSPPRDDVEIRGICEACSLELYWTWKKLLVDAAPAAASEAGTVSRVKVLVARRRSMSPGNLMPDVLSSSYDFLMVNEGEGDALDLPSADVLPGEPDEEAAVRALGEHDLLTWPPFLTSLYVAHLPRGRLCRVYLARAYAVSGATAPQWRAWPLGDHAPALAGFYEALRDVWPLVLRQPRATSEICVGVRRGSAEYLRIQQQVRSGDPNVDTSMLEYLRRGMTDDEKLVVQELAKEEDLGKEAGAAEDPGRASEDIPGEALLAEEIPDFESEHDGDPDDL